MMQIPSRMVLKKRPDDGFTVAEFVIAAAILFIVVMGVLGAVEFAAANTRMAGKRQQAINIATQKIEYARNIPWASLGTAGGNPTGALLAQETTTTPMGTYTITTKVWWALDGTGTNTRSSYKRMSVTVAWASPSPGGSISAETAIAGQGGTGGDVVVRARDDDNPSLMYAGVSFTMGSAGTISTDSNGLGVWGQVANGSYTLTGSCPNLLVDMSGMPNPFSYTGGFKDLGFVDCQVPCTAAIKVVSSGGAVISGATVTLVNTAKTPNITYTAVTDANGFAYFDAAHNTVNGTAGLWKTSGLGYTATAVYGGVSSQLPVAKFDLATGGAASTGVVLTIPDPPTMTVRIFNASTNAQITGVPFVVTAKNPSNVALSGSGNSFTDSALFTLTTTGDHSVAVSGVTGFMDKTVVFTVSSLPGGHACDILLTPMLMVDVNDTYRSAPNDGVVGAKVTVKDSGGNAELSSAGVTPGITAATGLVGFPVLADSNYTISAVVNGLTYTGTPSPLWVAAASPPASPYSISITPGTLSVAVTRGGTTWQRLVGIFDSSGTLVASKWSTYAASTVVFPDMYPGMYTISVYSSSVTTLTPLPGSTLHKDFTLTAPGVQPNATYSYTGAYALN